ncbi:unnamed protein product [Phyllotreta striolata]|uniref:Lipase maturation factor n=1 Tax=Phyllotreta striolata TaxID=444603 RepID=A0A9P0DTB1_PHYSR|nr:unnamed protein product [Phyllotreta striolata]
MKVNMIPLRYTRNLILRALCVVYLSAFLSFYAQIPGLYGDNGIVPARTFLENTKHESLAWKIHHRPTLLWLTPFLGLDVTSGLDVLALTGAFLAFTGVISQKFCTIPLFAGLWSLYFSLHQIGRTFAVVFDEFLLETGFLAVFVAPLLPGRRGSRGAPHNSISFWMIKWLLFRFLVVGGFVKHLSGDSVWWTLKGLIRYYETIPLPSPLSWYVYGYIPEWGMKFAMVFTNVVEIALPFLYFLPIRSVRITGFFLHLYLQLCILLTGNFGIWNILMMTLSLALLDDHFFYKRKTSAGKGRTILSLIFNVGIHALIAYGAFKLFSLKLDGSKIASNFAITKNYLEKYTTELILYIVYYGLVTLAATVLYAISNALFDKRQSTSNKLVALMTTLFYATIAILVFLASTVPIASLSPMTNSTVNPTVRMVYNRLHKLNVVNHYESVANKFPSTPGRYEIVFEGADNVEGPWKEYNFLYKPGNPNSSLPFVAPHQPRLDWHLAKAAYEPYERHPWVLSFVHRILEHQNDVLALIDFRDSPFRRSAPKYLRALLYKYEYTGVDKRNERAWWKRTKLSEYVPALTKDSPFLLDFLKARHLLPAKAVKPAGNSAWKKVLNSIRYVINHLESTLLFWSVLSAGLAIISTKSSNTGVAK